MTKLAQVLPIDPHWAIHPAFAERSEGILASLTIEAADAARKRADEEEESPLYDVVNGTAVFGLNGPMTKKPTSMAWLFGGTSTIMLRRALSEALRDRSVKRGLLLTDSPGGQAQGNAELADAIREFAAKKPIGCFVDGMAASAAYWAASACDFIACGRMSEVGCIGTYSVMTDTSQMLAAAGAKRVVYRAGKFKGAGYPGTEITPDMHAEFQREVEAINDVFVSDVAAGRGLSAEQAKELADGRIHVGQAAVDLGLADCVCSLEECFQMLSSGQGPNGKTAARNGEGDEIMESQENPSFLERLAAFFKREGIDIDASGGGEQPKAATTQPAAITQLDPAIAAQMEELEKNQASFALAMAQEWASSTATKLVPKKAAPAEKDAICAALLEAAKADGGGSPKLADGKLLQGPMTKSLLAMIDARKDLQWTAATVGVERQPGATVLEDPGPDNKDMEARAKELLSRTPAGREALARKEKVAK